MKSFCIGLILLSSCTAVAQPWSPQVIWQRNGAGGQSLYGAFILATGDQNDDHFSDFAVMAWGSGSPGQASEPLLEFFHGGNPISTAPYMVMRGTVDPRTDLLSAVSMGDLNGDRYQDWATIVDTSASLDQLVRFYFGGPVADTVPDLTVVLPSWHDNFGSLGDFNGDGYADFYVYDADVDSLLVFYGGQTPDAVPDWTPQRPAIDPRQVIPSSSGDLNGDGFDDFIGRGQTQLNVFWGGTSPSAIAGQTMPGSWRSTEIINDLNGDGRAELLTHGISDYEIRWGRDTLSAQPDLLLAMPCEGSGAEWQAVSSRNVNRDHWNDLIIVEHECANDWWGSATLYLGSPWMSGEPTFTFWGGEAPADSISYWTAAGLGDVNGDSIADLALGGFNDTNIGFRGKAVVIAGDSSLRVDVGGALPPMPQQLEVSAYPNPFNGAATIALEVPVYSAEVKLTVYNLMGQTVQAIVLHDVAGTVHQRLDASTLSSGVYLLRVNVGLLQTAQKLVVLK